MSGPDSAASRSVARPLSARLLLRAAGQVALREREAIDLEPKDALLLAYLALEGPTPRARLAALLWPEADEERARGNLRQRLLRLKRTTSVELVVGSPVARLADGIAHDLDDAREVLVAIEVSQAGGLADWLLERRARQARARAGSLAAAAMRAEADGDFDAALAHAQALLDLEPLSEHAHRRVMSLHYLRGDAAAALAAYERCRQILKRELKAAPSPETEAMRARVERAAAPASPGAVPICVLRPPRLIGREWQWAALQAACDGGEPAVVLGEAGMGKTRLVADFSRARGRTLLVSARPGDEGVVYALVARLLRQLPRDALTALDASVRGELARLLPEFGQAEPIRSELDRARFFNAVAAALGAAESFAGIAIDDLHFADEASLELVQYLAAGSRLHWLFAARPAEIGAAARALVDGLHSKGRVVELAPLTARQIEALVTSLELPGVDAAAWAPRLLRHTGGNPLFVLETVKAWLAQPGASQGAGTAVNLPAVTQVGALIERRLTRLSAEAIRLARCAAVAGQDFSAELASHVLGARPLDLADAWAELEAAQVFRDGAFAHDLIHEAALASVPPPIAQQLHREIAGYLERRAAPAARLAEHWLAAGDDRRAFDALMRAARSAQRQTLRLAEAAQLYERAARAAERLGDDEGAFDALHALCDVFISLDRGRLDEALLRRLNAHANTPHRQARALAMQGQVALQRGRHAEACSLALRAAEQARAAGDEELAVMSVSDAAAAASQLGDSDRAVRLLRPLLPWTLERASDETRIHVLGHLALCLDNIDHQAEAQPIHGRAIESALRVRRYDQAVSGYGNLAISLLDLGRPQAALAAIEDGRRLAVAYDVLAGSGFTLNLFQGIGWMMLRRYRAALGALDSALGDLAHDALAAAAVCVHRACLWIQLGQFARARRELADAASIGGLPSWLEARRWQMLGRCAWWGGRKKEAEQHWKAAADRAPTNERAALAAMIALDCALVKPPDEAQADVRQVLARAEKLGHAGSVLAAQIRLTQLAQQSGDRATALRALADAQQTADEIEPNDLYRGELWLAAVRTLHAAGRQHEADEALRMAAGAIRRIAAEHTPPEFCDSFLHRNPVNRELMTLATRRH